jgi:hypothetical protein
MAARDEHLRGFSMEPGWDRNQPDPNWSGGEYHGMRMRPGGRQAAYGFHRLTHESDLRGYGGFFGLYDEGPGKFDAAGTFHHHRLGGARRGTKRLLGSRAAGLDDRSRVEDGGVRADNRYLRQYNAESSMLKDGREQELGYGHAPSGGRDGVLTDSGRRERATDERGKMGYNQGGFANEGGPGVDPGK